MKSVWSWLRAALPAGTPLPVMAPANIAMFEIEKAVEGTGEREEGGWGRESAARRSGVGVVGTSWEALLDGEAAVYE